MQASLVVNEAKLLHFINNLLIGSDASVEPVTLLKFSDEVEGLDLNWKILSLVGLEVETLKLGEKVVLVLFFQLPFCFLASVWLHFILVLIQRSYNDHISPSD